PARGVNAGAPRASSIAGMMVSILQFPRRPATPVSDDAPLVAAARGGDRAAFAALHARYGRMVHAILLGRVAARDAADLVQDVFLRALERLGTLRDDAAFGGWLAQIARHRAADHLRARRGESDLPEDLAARDGASGRAEVGQALAAIRALPDAYRETLLMR